MNDSAVLFIDYPPEFNSFEKFSRKINNICQKIDISAVYCVNDSNGLIQKFSEGLKSARLAHFSKEDLPICEVTHAIIFESEDALFKPLVIHGVPTRRIKVLITRVINKDVDNDYDVYIGRGTKWGNPYAIGFSLGEDGEVDSREEVIRKYQYDFERGLLGGKNFKSEILGLRGKRLGCHCKPYACHGDIIANYLNSIDDGL